ncbi:MAG: hypothetical protein IH991_08280 [Planctomycetes bacterium]|nr:hypothetical protein [Planctomycetota bacterium]
MSIPMTAQEVLDREFLEVRAKILELAASLDRLERADGAVTDDHRVALVREAFEVLQGARSDRAEQVQLIFSREYEDDWREKHNLSVRS